VIGDSSENVMTDESIHPVGVVDNHLLTVS